MLTREDYKKIEDFLKRNSIKDSDFSEIENIDGDEFITVYKGNNNYKVSVRNTQRVGKETLEGGEIFNSYEGPERNMASSKSFAVGVKTNADGYASTAEGNNTLSEGAFSHTEGSHTYTIGRASHAEGIGTETTQEGEHAQGIYNKSNGDTISSVGIGTGERDRKNAIEITRDGEIYIDRIGGFNEIPSGDSLQEVLHNITRRLEELENSRLKEKI